MTPEKNKAIVKKYFEMWNTGNTSLADEVLSLSYIDYSHPEIKETESVRQSVIKIRGAYPDFHITLETMICEGDIVAVMGNISRTQEGEKVIFNIMWFVTLANEKMTALRTGIVSSK